MKHLWRSECRLWVRRAALGAVGTFALVACWSVGEPVGYDQCGTPYAIQGNWGYGYVGAGTGGWYAPYTWNEPYWGYEPYYDYGGYDQGPYYGYGGYGDDEGSYYEYGDDEGSYYDDDDTIDSHRSVARDAISADGCYSCSLVCTTDGTNKHAARGYSSISHADACSAAVNLLLSWGQPVACAPVHRMNPPSGMMDASAPPVVTIPADAGVSDAGVLDAGVLDASADSAGPAPPPVEVRPRDSK